MNGESGVTLLRTTPLEQLPEYLSPEELAAYLQLGRNTVYDLLRRNEIPHRRFGRQIRIHKADTQQFEVVSARLNARGNVMRGSIKKRYRAVGR